MNQEECEQFCKENAGCAGYLHRHGKNNCKGQCHIRPGTPDNDLNPGPLRCRYNQQGAGYHFYESPDENYWDQTDEEIDTEVSIEEREMIRSF